MFKNSCYIENSEGVREELRLVGYIISHNSKKDHKYILANKNGVASTFNEDSFNYLPEEVTDCIGNLPLFKALTAVRDDSDYMQWFIHDLCFFDESLEDRMVLCEKEDHKYLNVYTHFRKATKEELIERFK